MEQKKQPKKNPEQYQNDKEEIILFLGNVSLVLGITLGAIHDILKGPDSEMRLKLQDLVLKLSDDVTKLYYSQPTQ